ncbi:MAG: methyltransferase domain-containing protein [Gaiellaceae bacterium]
MVVEWSRTKLLHELRCPDHRGQALLPREDDTLECASGCTFPVVGGIPRFVGKSSYADAFGLQWNRFRTIQHDSRTGTTISRDRLERCLGGFAGLRGRSVLEVGCGSGRFTEILLAQDALVLAVDLSSAVEANHANFADREGYAACQADVRRLPVAPRSFGIVLALGLVQHTPVPEETIAALADVVAPGGRLVFDHYGEDYPYTLPRRIARGLFLSLTPRAGSAAAGGLARLLLPVHRLTWYGDWKGRRRLRRYLMRVSPLVDYFDAYSQLGRETLATWSILDTHDTLTDRYKHLRTPEQLREAVDRTGLVVEELRRGGNGIEVRARRPEAA